MRQLRRRSSAVNDQVVACVVGDHCPVDLSHASGRGGIGGAVVSIRSLVQVELALGAGDVGRHLVQRAGVRVDDCVANGPELPPDAEVEQACQSSVLCSQAV